PKGRTLLRSVATRLIRRRLACLFAGSVPATGERRSRIESETTLKKRRYYITDAVAWNVTGAQFMGRITISHCRGLGFRVFGGRLRKADPSLRSPRRSGQAG